MTKLELSNVQALVVTGYVKSRPHAEYLFFSVRGAREAQRFIGELSREVTYVGTHSEVAIHVAFTHDGLQMLGLPKALLEGFEPEFVLGMSERARALGDDDATVDQWRWGNGKRPVHVMVLTYAADRAQLDAKLKTIRDDAKGALDEVHSKATLQLPDGKEHFGFKDGISQPSVVTGAMADPNDTPLGEFVLGYPNVYGKRILDPILDDGNHPELIEGSFGRDGTYLVARELTQHVHAFWSFLHDQASGVSHVREGLAEKMVGRRKNGTSLVRTSDALGDLNTFNYKSDASGRECPIGSHVRRANPRDSLDPVKTSVEFVRGHRILRRGRSFGEPNFTPLETGEDNVDRGLMFICLNANIRRQFEFVQQTWVNSTKFGGLYDERDPLIGAPASTFSVPDHPVRARVSGLPRFTAVRGGGYFFMPGRHALSYLTKLA